ncbi:MAG: thioredoxin domain-containing protein [Shimia sp.]
MKRFLPAIASGGGVYWFTSGQGAQPPAPALGAANAQTVADPASLGVPDMVLGAADAPVTVIEYASYTCPHCRRFHEGPFKELKAEYIDTGQVRFVYREVYFDRFGLWASMVARCGGEARFFGITDLLYDQQQSWARGEPSDIVAALRRIGLTAGLTEDQIDACFEDAEQAETLVAWWQANAEADDISSTPTFLIDGEKHGNMTMDAFRNILDAKLEG